jgi:hypothetical protein
MARLKARSVVKTIARKLRADPISLLFAFCTLAMLSSTVRMWIHWTEISAVLGAFRAASTLTAVTGAAVIVSWWLNTGNE